MFDLAVKKSECFTRGLRIGSYFLLVFSICLFFSPITALLGYIPLLGGFISQVVAWAIFIAALIICIPIYLIMTSIAWVRFHPKVGIAILAIGLAILAGILIYNNSKQGSSSSGGTATHFMTMHRYYHTWLLSKILKIFKKLFIWNQPNYPSLYLVFKNKTWRKEFLFSLLSFWWLLLPLLM